MIKEKESDKDYDQYLDLKSSFDPKDDIEVHVFVSNVESELNPYSYTTIDGSQYWFPSPESLSKYVTTTDDKKIKESLTKMDTFFIEPLDQDFEKIFYEVWDDLHERQSEDKEVTIMVIPK